MKPVLLIPKLRIHNANALSSPYTIGFPAMTAWLGAVHALERKLKEHEDYRHLQVCGTAVICHQINLQIFKDINDSIYSIIGTGNPLDKQGQRCAFVEEARCHLQVSLVIQCKGLNTVNQEKIIKLIIKYLMTMKMASGDILDFETPELIELHGKPEFNKLIRRLIPGYCLIERRDLMKQAMENGLDAIDALLDHLSVFHRCTRDQNGRVTWHSNRKKNGRIVPIAVGFHGISKLGITANQREPDTPHRFGESIVTLGEFVMPYRLNSLNALLWHTHVDLKNNLYLCQQN